MTMPSSVVPEMPAGGRHPVPQGPEDAGNEEGLSPNGGSQQREEFI